MVRGLDAVFLGGDSDQIPPTAGMTASLSGALLDTDLTAGR